MSHTPGPWRIIEHSWAETSIAENDLAGPVCSLSIREMCTEETQEEMEGVMGANARLIAAAPDLLEAMEVLMNPGGVSGIPRERQQKALAAIAKARGEA